jgi:YbgC/YbaW family acyl-CoA thioester hydrolase
VPAELETIIEVLESDCDRLGHLNHVKTVRMLERARGHWYTANGLRDAGRNYVPVVVNINYNYRRECFLGERLRVVTRGQRLGRKSFTLGHEIIKPDGATALQGEATSVIMDLDSRVIVTVPECVASQVPAPEAAE